MPKLVKLRIAEFRGIRSLEIDLSGRSVAILGANGSGKSSVVDAIDFLLTGGVRRLTGQGTGSFSLVKHGPHVDATTASAWVEAVFVCPDHSEPITLRRRLAAPETLEKPSGHALPPSLSALLRRCHDTGLHLLTRREIARFILAEPSRRAEQVASLLQIDRIDAVRLELQGAHRIAIDDLLRLRNLQAAQRAGALRAVVPAAASFELLLQRLNAHRRLRGAPDLPNLKDAAVLQGVVSPQQAATNPLQSATVRARLNDVLEWFERRARALFAECADYRASLRQLRNDAVRLKSMRAAELVSRGLDLLAAAECPLCLTPWDPPALRSLLEERLEEGKEASDTVRGTRDLSTRLRRELAGVVNTVETLARDCVQAQARDASVLADYASALKDAVRYIVPDVLDGEVVTETAVLDAIPQTVIQAGIDVAQRFAQAANALPELEGAHRAWDELNRADVALKELRHTADERRLAEQVATFLKRADESFVQARDHVLQGLYDAIATAFAELYRDVNQDDEAAFVARLEPTRAGLKLEVDFHGRGRHPPGALHSEGHQDGMGVCLFLALVEELSEGSPPLVVLDDVVMSVDRGHRRALAELLAARFTSTQFIVTTHDRVWWSQLRTVGLVAAKSAITIEGWTIEDGPEIGMETVGFFSSARAALSKRDVPRAAHALRRGIEALGPELCDRLGASIRYREDGSWSAGEYLGAALGQFGNLLKRAKAAANSWNQDLSRLQDLDETRADCARRIGGENWAVNVSVHFNEWADLGPEDFEPVLKAYEDLLALLRCSECEALLRTVEEHQEATSLRCLCGRIAINLQPRPKPTEASANN